MSGRMSRNKGKAGELSETQLALIQELEGILNRLHNDNLEGGIIDGELYVWERTHWPTAEDNRSVLIDSDMWFHEGTIIERGF